MIRVLMVCMGNICRSPTAEAVLRQRIKEAKLEKQIEVDSAGTSDGHVGSAPDRRSQAQARLRGYDMAKLKARVVRKRDFTAFDLILAMDQDNLVRLQAMQPTDSQAEIGLLRHWRSASPLDFVPDPYYGDTSGFEQVLDLIEDSCDQLISDLTRRLENPSLNARRQP